MAWTAPRTWTAGETLTANLLNTQLRDNLLAAFPVGKLEFFMQGATSVETTINGGWLECNGTAVSRTTYSSLNSLLSGLSYPFGAGNGTTTFNLPDLRGRSLIMHGTASGHASVNALGDTEGEGTLGARGQQHEHTHNLSVASHSHNANANANSNHSLTIVGGGSTNGSAGGGAVYRTPASGTEAVSGTITTSVSVTVGSASPSLSGGVGITSGPTDAPAYAVCGVWGVKT